MGEERVFLTWRNARMFLMAGIALSFLVALIFNHQSIWMFVCTLALVVLLVLATTVKMGDAALSAIILGLVMAVFTKNTGYVGMFGVVTILAGIFHPLGRIVSVTAFLFGAMGLGIVYEPDLLYEMVPSLLAGAALFFLIPGSTLEQIETLAGTGREKEKERDERKRELDAKRWRMQTLECARRWKDLSESFSILPFEREMFTLGSSALDINKIQTAKSFARPRLNLISGVSRSVGNSDCISGDNYSIYPIGVDRLLVFLSDGMGSGRQAYHDSDQVISRMEDLVEAGFSTHMGVSLVHRWLLAQGREDVGTTLDVADINLHTGEGILLKAGAAASFLLNMDETGVWSARLFCTESMPLGIFNEPMISPGGFKLKAGNILVMMTDGVLDGLAGEMKEERMKGFLEYEAAKISDSSPGRVAQGLSAAILEFALSESKSEEERDDMTVLTFVVTRA